MFSSLAREERIRQSRGNLLEDINGMHFLVWSVLVLRTRSS